MGVAKTSLLIALALFVASCSEPAPELSDASEQASIGEAAMSNLQGKKILLAGATGNNGRYVLQRLGELGLDVRPMSRNIERAAETFGSQYDWVQADVTDAATLDAAVKDVDIVISAVATAMPLGGNRPEMVDYVGTVNLAAAAKAAGATRFVIITSSSSGEKDHFLNKIANDVLIWKGKAEQVLVDSGMEYVVVGPAGIDDRPGGIEAINLIPRSEYVAGMFIGRQDLAAVTIAAAGHPDAKNRVFTATNAEGAASDAWLDRFAVLPTDLNLPED